MRTAVLRRALFSISLFFLAFASSASLAQLAAGSKPLDGKLSISGSSTVHPLMIEIVQRFGSSSITRSRVTWPIFT